MHIVYYVCNILCCLIISSSLIFYLSRGSIHKLLLKKKTANSFYDVALYLKYFQTFVIPEVYVNFDCLGGLLWYTMGIPRFLAILNDY